MQAFTGQDSRLNLFNFLSVFLSFLYFHLWLHLHLLILLDFFVFPRIRSPKEQDIYFHNSSALSIFEILHKVKNTCWQKVEKERKYEG